MICRMVVFAVVGLLLGGCSVVVFEDDTACPSQLACPVESINEEIPSNLHSDSSAEPSLTDSDEKLKSTTEEQVTSVPSDSSITPTEEKPIVDGYTSYFDTDSAIIRERTIAGLLFVADHLKANPAIRIMIEGHCDERGTRDYNLALGEKRAEAVRIQLSKMGVDRSRIKTRSFGKERPAVLGTSPEAWAKNRRTVIRLLAE